MGWNLGLVLIRHEPADAVDFPALEGLEAIGDLTNLAEASGRDRLYSEWAVGRWNELVVAVHAFPMHEVEWGQHDHLELVLALHLSENHASNALSIFERGELVRQWDENEAPSVAASIRHPLERGLRGPDVGVHPADYVNAVAERLTGHNLFASNWIDALQLWRYRA